MHVMSIQSNVYALCCSGSYDEISSLCKTAVVGEPNLPTNRHAGYIVIAFKLLDDANKVSYIRIIMPNS